MRPKPIGYVRGTQAEIARKTGVHESTVSRKQEAMRSEIDAQSNAARSQNNIEHARQIISGKVDHG